MPLDEKAVREAVNRMENDADHMALRSDAEKRYELYDLVDLVDLPEHMTRGVVVEANSPLLGWLSDTLSAEMMSYPTYVTVTPYDKEDQKLADKIEKFAQLWLGRVNDGRRLEGEGRWHQMNTGWYVWILTTTDDEHFPWEVLSPDPLTCYFPIKGSPFRPRRLARKYKMLVGELMSTYADKRGSRPKHRPYYKKDGSWGWEQLSDDYADTGDVVHAHSDRGSDYEEVTCLWLADGKNVYHVVLNKDGKSGQTLWVGPDVCGGVPAVVVPGRVTPRRKASERLRPMFYPAYQMIKLINRVRAKRETRSDQALEDVFVQQDAEIIKAETAARQAGIEPDDIQLERGKASIIKTPGTIALWERQADEDLDKNEQSYWAELDRYLNTWLENTSPDVLADSKANVYLTYAESRRKQLAPILTHMDWGWAELIKMALHTIPAFNEEYTLFADESFNYGDGKKIARGEGVSLKPSDLVEFDKRFRLTVTTKSVTDAERRMAVQDWAYKRSLGIAKLREGVTAAGYADETEHIKDLLVEAAIEQIAPQLDEQIAIAVEESIMLESDMMITLAHTPRNAGAPPPTGGGGMPRMSPAAIPGPAGGSDAAVIP